PLLVEDLLDDHRPLAALPLEVAGRGAREEAAESCSWSREGEKPLARAQAQLPRRSPRRLQDQTFRASRWRQFLAPPCVSTCGSSAGNAPLSTVEGAQKP